jgi:predicted RNA-binding protein with PUA-like domain
MRFWLVKQEPTSYTFARFVSDRTTWWTGVHHPTAQRNLKEMRARDRGIYYHTGSERAAVGTFQVVGLPRADPDDDRGAWMVELRADRPLTVPVSMATVRSDPAFARSPLVREPRLSIVPLSRPEWERFLQLGGDLR